MFTSLRCTPGDINASPRGRRRNKESRPGGRAKMANEDYGDSRMEDGRASVGKWGLLACQDNERHPNPLSMENPTKALFYQRATPLPQPPSFSTIYLCFHIHMYILTYSALNTQRGPERARERKKMLQQHRLVPHVPSVAHTLQVPS